MTDLNRRTFLSLPIASVLIPTAQAAFPPERQAAQPPKQIDFTSNLPAKGTFPEKWIHGSPSCLDNTDPPIQVHWYNEHTALLRQNKAYNYEAPFMHLYFGNDRILLIDEGYTKLAHDWPLRATVESCIEAWCARNHRNPEDLQLLLAFTHLHDDHYAAIDQFADRPNTRAMGLTHEQMIGFWGMTNYPDQRVALDLGGRTILIWGSPGHVLSEFAYYDTYTQILFTGDMFYAGRCYISFWDKWFASMQRLIAFVDTHPVTHIVGCHVEISRTGEEYPYGITYQPDEAPLQLSVDDLRHAYAISQKVTEPGIYFTGKVFLCNQTRGTTTVDQNPYAYD